MSWILYSNFPIFCVPTGVIRFCDRKRIGDILAGQAAALERARIEIDLYLPRLTAERKRDRRPGNRDERRAQDVEAEIGKRLFRHALAGQRQLDDRHGRGVVVQDQGRRGAGRQLSQQSLGDRRDLGIGDTNIHVRLKEHLDDTDTDIGVGFDMLDVVHRCRQRTLKRRRDATGHLIRLQPGVLPDHGDDGDLDLREDVDRCAQDGERPGDQNDQREHQKRVRAL